jgi:hypothetical protein
MKRRGRRRMRGKKRLADSVGIRDVGFMVGFDGNELVHGNGIYRGGKD